MQKRELEALDAEVTGEEGRGQDGVQATDPEFSLHAHSTAVLGTTAGGGHSATPQPSQATHLHGGDLDRRGTCGGGRAGGHGGLRLGLDVGLGLHLGQGLLRDHQQLPILTPHKDHPWGEKRAGIRHAPPPPAGSQGGGTPSEGPGSPEKKGECKHTAPLTSKHTCRKDGTQGENLYGFFMEFN